MTLLDFCCKTIDRINFEVIHQLLLRWKPYFKGLPLYKINLVRLDQETSLNMTGLILESHSSAVAKGSTHFHRVATL